MKKQKMLKLIASISEPSLESSFSAPLTHSGEISVVSKGKSISIHGWDGNAWSTIHVAGGSNPQFKFENTYESYYLKSLTGQEEEIYVSFFSIGSIQNSKPQLAGIQRPTKLYDIDEVPIYSANDANKLLTVMSDGSLRWLLLNETFNVDGSPVVENNPNAWADSAQLFGDTSINNGVMAFDGTGDYATISDGFRFTDNLSISVWFKTTATGDRRIYSCHVRSQPQPLYNNGFFARLEGGQLRYRHPAGGTSEISGPSGLNNGVWHNFVMTWTANGTWFAYLNGAQINTGTSGAANGYVQNWPLYIGANPWNGSQPYGLWQGEIKNLVIANEKWTEAEVLEIYNAGQVESVSPEPVGLELIGSTAQTFVRANGDFINFGDNVDYDRSAGEDFAVEIDVNFASSPGSNVYDIVGKGANNFSSGWAILAYTASGTPSLRMFANTSAAINGDLGFNAAFNPVIGQWYTIKAVWRASGVQELWVDGFKVAERTKSSSYLPPVNSSYDLKTGQIFIEAGKDRSFDGQIRNLVIYKGNDA